LLVFPGPTVTNHSGSPFTLFRAGKARRWGGIVRERELGLPPQEAAAARLPSPVDTAPVLGPMNENDAGVLIDLVDHPELPPPGAVKTFQFAPKWLADSLGILGDRIEDGGKDRRADLVGQAVEMPESFRGDLNRENHLAFVLQGQAVAFSRLAARSS